MTPLSAANTNSPAVKQLAGHQPATHGARSDLPTLFLMIDSLQTGGSERQFVALNRVLNREQFQVSLGCIQTKGALLEAVDGQALPRFPFGGSVYGLQSWKTRLNLLRHLRKQKVTIAHAFDFYTNLLLIPSARFAGVPVVIGSQRQLGDLLTPAQARAQRMMFHRCDVIVCNSNAAAKRLIDDGLRENKIRVIWNGLDLEAFSSAEPALPKRSGWRRVGMIARMNSKAKNHSLFLRAAGKLAAVNPQVEFVLAGDGALRPELEQDAANLGLGHRVRFLGDRQDIPAVLASLDLTVLPSNTESLSNSIIESMAAGVPVVATDVGSNPELLAENRGVLVPVGDENGLVAAMARLLQDDHARKQMGESSRTFARANFTIERMGRQYEDLYTELLSRKRIFHTR